LELRTSELWVRLRDASGRGDGEIERQGRTRPNCPGMVKDQPFAWCACWLKTEPVLSAGALGEAVFKMREQIKYLRVLATLGSRAAEGRPRVHWGQQQAPAAIIGGGENRARCSGHGLKHQQGKGMTMYGRQEGRPEGAPDQGNIEPRVEP